MTELSQVRFEMIEQPVADATDKLAKSNQRAVDILVGAQRLVLDELIFAGNEMLNRATTEAHLAIEFCSKMAEAHSVKNVRTRWRECAEHQIDFLRRESERIFKHGERVNEKMALLFSTRRQG